MAKEKTVDEIVEGIPEDMRGHVFHALGKVLGHKGGVHTDDDTPRGDGDSGGNGPPPPPPGH